MELVAANGTRLVKYVKEDDYLKLANRVAELETAMRKMTEVMNLLYKSFAVTEGTEEQ